MVKPGEKSYRTSLLNYGIKQNVHHEQADVDRRDVCTHKYSRTAFMHHIFDNFWLQHKDFFREVLTEHKILSCKGVKQL
jgi:hypothetical protein